MCIAKLLINGGHFVYLFTWERKFTLQIVVLPLLVATGVQRPLQTLAPTKKHSH